MQQPSFDLLARSIGHPGVLGRRAGWLPGVAVGTLACLTFLLGVGCGTDSDYEAAVRTNTVSAFDDYLRLHPDGTHSAEARAHLAALVEDREWQRARAGGSSDAYQQYLRGYPSGAHAHDALTAIADLNLATVPSTEAPTTAADPVPSPRAPAASPAVEGPIARAPAPPVAEAPTTRSAAAKPAASSPPKAAVAKETHAAPTAAAGVRIQLGAFGAKAGAESAWHRLTRRYPELASRTPLIAAAKAGDGRDIERLQVGGFSHESASAMCAALAAKHDACLVVPATGAAAN